MTVLQYPLFYKLYGIRRDDQMIKPPLPLLSLLSLPRNAIYHYLGTGPLDDGPTERENALKDVKKTMFIATVAELTSLQGNPRQLPLVVDRLARNHRVKNPKFIPMKELAISQRDPAVPIVYNYAYLQRLYKYQRNYYASYNRWSNFLATVWRNIATVAAESDRQHFVEFDLPRVLPSVSFLRSAQHEVTQKLAGIFSNLESVALLEFWKWLGEERNLSSMNFVRPQDLSKINVVFRESERWFVINLGALNAFRGPSKEELRTHVDEVHDHAKLKLQKGYPPEQLQKRFLRLEMALFEARTSNPDQNLGTDEDEKPATKLVGTTSNPDIKITPADPAPKPKEKILNPVPNSGVGDMPSNGPVLDVSKPSTGDPQERDAFQDLDEIDRDELAEQQAQRDAQYDDAEPEIEQTPSDQVYLDDELKEDIDKDLEHLERIADNAHPEQGEQEQGNFEVVVPTAKDLEGAIVDYANALADAGGLSAAEYRRYVEAAGNYRKIPAPGGKTMGEFIDVKPEDVEIKESAKIPDKLTVVDKTMLKSSLLDFDSKYVTEVMQRDVASMVMSLQNAGILVLDYASQETEDITGAYIEYAVKVKPLQGTPSTLRFKMPKVSPNGAFTINGVNYRTRKQKGD